MANLTNLKPYKQWMGGSALSRWTGEQGAIRWIRRVSTVFHSHVMWICCTKTMRVTQVNNKKVAHVPKVVCSSTQLPCPEFTAEPSCSSAWLSSTPATHLQRHYEAIDQIHRVAYLFGRRLMLVTCRLSFSWLSKPFYS